MINFFKDYLKNLFVILVVIYGILAENEYDGFFPWLAGLAATLIIYVLILDRERLRKIESKYEIEERT